MHTHIHTYTHTHIHTYTHAYMHAYIHTYMHAYYVPGAPSACRTGTGSATS